MYCYNRRDEVVLNKYLITLGTVTILGLFLVFFPFARQITAPGIIQHKSFVRMYSAQAGKVQKIYVHSGQKVARNAILVQLKSPEINHSITDIVYEIKILQRRLEIHRLLSSIMGYQQADRDDLRAKQNVYHALEEKKAKLTMYAPFAGQVVTINHEVNQGRWLPKDTFVLELVAKSRQLLTAYVPEYDINKIHVGDQARFYPDNLSEPILKAHVVMIAKTKTQRLEKPYLASYHGGDIEVTGSIEQPSLTLKESRFKVALQPDTSIELKHMLRGHVVILSKKRESLFYRIWVRFWGVLIRESGF